MAKADRLLQVVLDAGPLIHLDELKQIGLLQDFSSVEVPDAVWIEVERHRPLSLASPPPNFSRHKPVSVFGLELARMGSALALDRGELEGLQLLGALRTAAFLTDDAAARLAATQMGYRVHGTLGVVLRAVRLQRISVQEAEETLLAIPRDSTLHVRRDLLAQAVSELRRWPGPESTG